MEIQIEKILNNNAVVILSEEGLETVVMGKGIAFRKKAGDMIPKEQINKVFTLTDRKNNSMFQELVTDIPIEHILISEKIIKYAKANLGKKLSDTIYVTLTDHISMAIQRYKEGIILKNGLLWDIKQFYPDEFIMGNKAIKMIQADTGIELLEDEAAFMAMHLVSAQLNEDTSLVYNMTKLIQDITNIVKQYFKIEYDLQALSYFRFINHLKFFAQRLFNNVEYDDDNDTSILDTIIYKYRKEYQCTQDIAHFIKQEYEHPMSNEEMLYMTIHITRIVRETRKKKTK